MKYKLHTLIGVLLIDEAKRQEWESHNELEDGSDLCLWTGHSRGSYYFGISWRRGSDLREIPRFAHIEKRCFIDLLKRFPLDWRCIIDSEVEFISNQAGWGWDFDKNFWTVIPNKVEVLSPR